jgi:tetratricopeptide (TPR) repeat protein
MGPIVLAFYLRARQFYLLFLWVLIAFCVTFTYSKGAWLGFGAGLIVFVFLSVGFFLQKQKATIHKTLIMLLTVTTIVIGAGMYHQLKQRPDSSSFRLFTWISTWEMIKTNPWLGTGLGTFYVTYPAWRRPQIFYIEGRHNTETDHPEDEYLEVWYDEGYVGFGIFLLLLTTFLVLSFRNLRVLSALKDEKKKTDIRAYYQLGILTAIIAQLVHNFVCVSLRFVSSGVMLWLLIGLIGALSIHHPLPAVTPEVPRKNLLPLPVRRLLQGAVILATGYFVWIFYGYFDADVNHNLAIFYSKQGQWSEALKHYDTVVKKNPSFIMAHYFLGNVFNDRWQEGDPDRSINKYEDVWRLAPNYVQSRHQAGLIYLKWGEDEQRRAGEARQQGNMKLAAEHEQKKNDIWKKALVEFEKYRTIDPIFPLNYYRIAWIYMQLGNYEKAEEAYKAHLEFPEKLKHPPYDVWVEDWSLRRTGEYAETCVNLGNLRFMRDDLAGAETYYQDAVRYNPKQVTALKNLAVIYGRQNHLDKARAAWENLRTIAPTDPDVQRVFQQQPR